MTSVAQPDLIPQPWSQNGSHTTIPDTTSEFGRASWALGFPPETALPLNAGGIPPNWLDFQGVLYALSQHAIFEQAGGRYAWVNDTNYPARACIIGSDGVMYQALQESGPGTSAGAKNPTSSGNSAYWGPLATPDGNTINLTNGKLAVNLSGVADGTTIVAANNKLSVSAAGIADGTTIIDNDGKLTAVGGGGGGDAASLVDNKTTVARSGKITVDLSNAPALSLHGISPYLVKANGGLAVDQSSGKMVADVSALADNITTKASNGKLSVNLTDATSAALTNISTPLVLAGGGLHVDETTGKLAANLIPLEADLDIYVDGANGSDTMVDGRGSESLPFATIQAAVNYVVRKFFLRQYNVSINIVPGVYDVGATLPEYLRTTGYISLKKKSGTAGTVSISTTNTSALTCLGGVWSVSGLSLTSAYDASGLTIGSTVSVGDFLPPNAYSSRDRANSPCLNIRDCEVSVSFTGSAPSGNNLLSSISVNRGRINCEGTISLQCTQGNSSKAAFFYVHDHSSAFVGSATMACSGTCTAFCIVYECSTLHIVTTSFTGTVIGKKYVVKYGSGVQATQALPGSIAGEADATTFGWYSEGLA